MVGDHVTYKANNVCTTVINETKCSIVTIVSTSYYIFSVMYTFLMQHTCKCASYWNCKCCCVMYPHPYVQCLILASLCI